VQIQFFEKSLKIGKILKTRENSNHSNEDFFFKSASFIWLKFKFRQISLAWKGIFSNLHQPAVNICARIACIEGRHSIQLVHVLYLH
jgi:hypothetical protein